MHVYSPCAILHADNVQDQSQESDADSAILGTQNVSNAGRGFSDAKKGDFATEYPNVTLPWLAERAEMQIPSAGWSKPVFEYSDAWCSLVHVIGSGFMLTAATKMQFLTEAGVQTMLASVFVGLPELLGVTLKRETVLKADNWKGPVEFTFWTKDDAILLVVEAKSTQRMVSQYEKSVEQLYLEMWAAWRHNTDVKKVHRPIAGMLTDGVGAVMFVMTLRNTSDGVQGNVECSNFLSVFSQAATMPGVHFSEWVYATMMAIEPECSKWEEAKWKKTVADYEAKLSSWTTKFLKIAEGGL